jgi:pimeloyl-ACP methyl ester carboxylesterase
MRDSPALIAGRRSARHARALVFLTAALVSTPSARTAGPPLPPTPRINVWSIEYVAHDGLTRHAYIVLPDWYGPRHHPRIPFVISPHGRGIPALDNVRVWGNLPAAGSLAVINPEGQGRRLTLYSWGDPGEINDLARMPEIATDALPWLRIDRHRIYAFGSSMGGQETLLLTARFPKLLAGAAAFDSPTNLGVRYRDFPGLQFGLGLQKLMRIEVGGIPQLDPRAYAVRSPLDYAREIAFSGVPLQIWWSRTDRVVVDQAQESGLLYRRIKKLNPLAPVVEFVGMWSHSAEFRWYARGLPKGLQLFGLLPPFTKHAPAVM